MADAFQSFDDTVKAGSVDATVGGAVPVELPPDLQTYGTLWPTPADMVSDHSAEGAPWLPTARDIPQDPAQGPLWTADHDGDSVPYSAQQGRDANTGAGISAPATGNHAGTGAALPAVNGKPNIGRPFTANQGAGKFRTLTTNQWDNTGKRITPQDAPSAPNEIFNSQHMTVPRFIPFEVAPLFENVGNSNQFTDNPGYWGVNAAQPDMAARPQGAVSAQMPSDPYVANISGTVPTSEPSYDLGL